MMKKAEIGFSCDLDNWPYSNSLELGIGGFEILLKRGPKISEPFLPIPKPILNYSKI